MKVLIACEESQRVCIEFRKRGHEAYSCDLKPCSGGHPEWHIQDDVISVLANDWDLIIAHPPCTYLTVTGNRWFNVERYGDKAIKRLIDRRRAIDFFYKFVSAPCLKIAIENPIGCMSTWYRKPDQIIQPWMFGDPYMKSTCLWLKGLPKLKPEITEKPDMEYHYWVDKRTGRLKRENQWIYEARYMDPGERETFRSKTFPGIARAMAEQWG